ncbi:hypothetical protein LIA77_07877 [Sarocladium implicatum]|nr:hypothetical protein LIA77_07877 [Sarocladium implicatum]
MYDACDRRVSGTDKTGLRNDQLQVSGNVKCPVVFFTSTKYDRLLSSQPCHDEYYLIPNQPSCEAALWRCTDLQEVYRVADLHAKGIREPGIRAAAQSVQASTPGRDKAAGAGLGACFFYLMSQPNNAPKVAHKTGQNLPELTSRDYVDEKSGKRMGTHRSN